MNVYRIWFSDGNDRDELGRVTCENIDQAIEYALKQYFKPDLEYEEDGDGDEYAYLRINSCKYCDKDELMKINDIEDEEELCEYCEISEYIEINLDNDVEPEYKTIFGVNEYADLSKDIKPEPYNSNLVKAWNMDPQTGVKELMYQTINNNPKLCDSVGFEYLKEINKSHEKVTKND